MQGSYFVQPVGNLYTYISKKTDLSSSSIVVGSESNIYYVWFFSSRASGSWS